MQTTIAEGELRALAGQPPLRDPEFLETWDLRYATWCALKHNKQLRPKWISAHIKNTILGYHHTACRVIGITRAALASLAGPDGAFTTQRATNTYQRSHLYPRRLVTQLILTLDAATTRDQLMDWVWHKDITVLSLRQENDLLEDEHYYRANALTFRNDSGDLFQDNGGAYSYGKAEKALLKQLHAKHQTEATDE